MKRFSFWSITLLLITLTVFAVNRRSAAEKSDLPVQPVTLAKATSVPAMSKVEIFDNYIVETYTNIGLAKAGLDLDVFRKAVIGYYNLKQSGKLSATKNILSIADFTKKSRNKRLWIVDLAQQKMLFHTFVTHGKNSGGDMATDFSNIPNSEKSSLGFYIANEIYYGKHGMSLKLDGMDEGFNSNARNRAVVVHGAAYANPGVIDQLGRLGRSQGCPALPKALTKPIIETIKNKTVLFINGGDESYTSTYLNQDFAAESYTATLPVETAPASSI
ncbi:MAG TPA: murein L,D-transpeptidase catalytic domain family protein [Sphingobacteriaceae bacterium]